MASPASRPPWDISTGDFPPNDSETVCKNRLNLSKTNPNAMIEMPVLSQAR